MRARPALDPEADLAAVVADLGGTPRAGQQEMAREVAGTLARGEHLLVQAGTGTGKSFGYLVPAIAHAVERGERVIVSTATLALQRQIVAKDAPRVAQVVAARHGSHPAVALLKGWQNYLCRYKVAGGYPADDEGLFAMPAAPTEAGAAADHPAADPEAGDARHSRLAAEVLRLREWAEETRTGDRDELDPGVTDRAWSQVSVSKLECLGAGCPMVDDCFPQSARDDAAEADVVVTNHAMLGIAAAGNPGLLPEHDVVIVDEAHDLAARATTAGTLELSGAVVRRTAKALARAGFPQAAVERAADTLTAALEPVPEGRLAAGMPPGVADAVLQVEQAARDAMSTLGEAGPPGEAGETQGAKAAAKAAALALFETCERLGSDGVEAKRDVLWCARPRVEGRELPPRLYLAPLDVAGLLGRGLFADRAVVVTSATLALGGGFDQMARQLGLALCEEPWRGIDVGSPFDHARQGILYVARHLPRAGRDGTSPQLLDDLVDLVRAAGGRTLGLFSSRRAAVAAAEHVGARVDTPVLRQGEDQLPVLVRRFREEEDTSLFGTLSLWQGVDVPGPALSLVVMDRIPFPRPDDPVASARAEAADAAGGNGFMSVSATHAALLLAQGAGRLLRRGDDRGVVAILDQRLVTARYGSFLLGSLPPMWRTTDRDVTLGALRRLTAGSGTPDA